MPYDTEQLRLLANLGQHYDVWLGAARRVATGRLKWKTVSGREYLYRVSELKGIDTSLGPRSTETEAFYEEYEVARATRDDSLQTLGRDASIYRALKLPMVPGFSGDVLRELDVRNMLGTSLLVVGTTALSAYEIEATERLPPGFDTTDDFDVTWVQPVLGADQPELPNAFLAALKSVDGTYTINTERQFQIRNSKGFEVELLLAESVSKDWSPQQRIRPIPLPEQNWLLLGTQVTQTICDLGGKAARIAAPDPRWFALHKLWLSQKPGRNLLKINKDMGQGLALLDLIEGHMPRFPLDKEFEEQIPAELLPHYEAWRANKKPLGR